VNSSYELQKVSDRKDVLILIVTRWGGAMRHMRTRTSTSGEATVRAEVFRGTKTRESTDEVVARRRGSAKPCSRPA
jgi:hypothetical protein